MVKGSDDVYKEIIYKSLFETATDSIFLMDENKFIECNTRTLEIFGCKSKSDILGKGPVDFSPEFQPSGELSIDVAGLKLKLALAGEPQLFEWKHSKLEGGEFFAEISLTKMDQGSKNILLAIVRDITVRKRFESELSDLQEYLQLQIDRMPIGLIGIDTSANIVSWNPSAEKIFGYTEKEILGKPLFDLIVPDSVTAEAEAIMQRLLQGDDAANNTNQNITKDKSIIICRWSNTPLKRPDGTVIGILSMVEDITDQNRAEEELRTYQNYLEELVRERTTDLEIAVGNLDAREKLVRMLSEITSASNLSEDPEEAIYFAIERIASVTGWPFGRMLYVDESGNIKDYSGIWFADKSIDKTRVNSILQSCMHTSDECPVNRAIRERLPIIIYHKKPMVCGLVTELISEHNLDASFVFPVEIDNRIIGVIQFLFTSSDLSASLYIDIVQQISVQLAMAIERKRIREELIQEKKRAEDANRSKSQFLANMSHEIRTPMNSIMGFADILSTKLDKKQNIAYLKSIQSSGASLLKLINDILDLSKIEADKLVLEYKELNIRSFFKEIFSLFEPRIMDKRLILKTHIQDSLPASLILDELRLRQVLVNLLGNAVKFTHTGRIEVNVFSEKQANNKLKLTIEFKDTGIGVSEEFIPLMFDSFQQEDENINRNYEGTGLGLSISKRLAELMNGEIIMESNKGKGTTCSLVLKAVELGKSEDDFEPAVEKSIDNLVFDKTTVLLVEDMPDDQKYFINLLENAELDITVVSNGDMALKALEQFIPSLIITDLKMPIIDGFALIEKIRSTNKYSRIPVIAISAAAMPEEIVRLENAGFDDYLIKPVSMKDFYRILANYLPYNIREKQLDSNKPKPGEMQLSLEAKENLPSVIEKLETRYLKDWERVKKKHPIEKVLEFGTNIKTLGDETGIKILSDYGTSLLGNVESFDIQALKINISNFPNLLSNLKKLE